MSNIRVTTSAGGWKRANGCRRSVQRARPLHRDRARPAAARTWRCWPGAESVSKRPRARAARTPWASCATSPTRARAEPRSTRPRRGSEASTRSSTRPRSGRSARLVDIDTDTWRRTFDTNVIGAARVTAAAIPHLAATSGTRRVPVVRERVAHAALARTRGVHREQGRARQARRGVARGASRDRLHAPRRGRLRRRRRRRADRVRRGLGSSTWPPSSYRPGSTRGYMTGALIDVEELVSAVDAVLRVGASLSMPSVTVAPRPDGPGAVMTSTKPVEFDPFSDEYFNDPTEMYRRLRDEAPVYFSEQYGFYALSRFADVLAAHRDWEGFSSAHGIELFSLSKDPEEIRELPAAHHDGPARARPLPGAGQPGVHAARRHRARADDPRGHLRLPRSVERRERVRRRRRLLGAVPGRGHLAHARRARGRTPADPPLARPRACTASRARSIRARRTRQAIIERRHVLPRAHGGEAQESRRRHAVAPDAGHGRPRRRRPRPASTTSRSPASPPCSAAPAPRR